MEIWQIPVIFIVGVTAGVINTLAGGGSLLTLPILIFLGLPTAMANGTNRFAIMVQCLFAVAGFKRKGISNFKLSLLLSAPALIGAIVGAQVAVDMSDALFKRVLAIIMLLVLGLILWNPTKKWQINPQSDGNTISLGWNRLIITMIVFFFIGIYGGFIQAGVGFIIIAALTTISGLNLVDTNSHKVFIVGIYTVFALLVFAFNGKICWTVGIALAAGNGLGGWLGSHWAVARGERWLRLILAVCVVAMVMKLFGLIP
ncbi:MAG TPA: sulfite exporter TauE/SafE family protein [Candidatus Scalindua sp.]|nr:sulfite exporter TauE/SafE family protein [Candidatus Scalindua sp.]